MKKKIAFVIPSLGVGGAEKSLIELIKNIDFNKYQIDLILFNTDGILTKEIDEHVQIHTLTEIEKLIFLNSKKSLFKLLEKKKFFLAIKKIFVSTLYKLSNERINDAAISWLFFRRNFKKNNNKYDVVISYLQGKGAYYTVDKMDAPIKILWVHTDYSRYYKGSKLDLTYVSKFNKIITVSQKAKNDIEKYFPEKSSHIHVITNIIDENSIIQRAEENNNYFYDKNKVYIVSVGRLHYAKGFDMVIPAIKKLINEGFNIKWFIVGEGKEREKLKKIIENYDLSENCIMVGNQTNPYAFMKKSDVYLQSSRYEGYCITLAEAKILCKPIITTNFYGADEQISHNENGLITDCNSESIYKSLKLLLKNENLIKKFESNLKENSYTNKKKESSVENLYKILEKR
ncbi:glycosyltransferase [Rossellomorea marisflavi]|uniref:glycosyltransferase n=1 Tax=Rossellomorea marisflavi TaxID=189381 RepID=UPI00345A9F3D